MSRSTPPPPPEGIVAVERWMPVCPDCGWSGAERDEQSKAVAALDSHRSQDHPRVPTDAELEAIVAAWPPAKPGVSPHVPGCTIGDPLSYCIDCHSIAYGALAELRRRDKARAEGADGALAELRRRDKARAGD